MMIHHPALHGVVGLYILLISVAWLDLTYGVDMQPYCADASLLLPFLLHQNMQGTSLIVFQGTAIPQVCFEQVLTV